MIYNKKYLYSYKNKKSFLRFYLPYFNENVLKYMAVNIKYFGDKYVFLRKIELNPRGINAPV